MEACKRCELLYSLRFVSLLLQKTRTFTLGFVVSHDHEEVETVNSRINPGVVYKAHNRKSASLKDDFIKSAMGAMDRTLSSFNEESSEGKIENEVEAGFRRRGTGQNISAKSFSSLECLVFTDLRD
ncbi:hypothetical protein Tco_0394727 [Tanacetum coccineum]